MSAWGINMHDHYAHRMENLATLHRLVYGDLSPLYSALLKEVYARFLSEHFTHITRCLHVQLDKEAEQIREIQTYYGSEIPPLPLSGDSTLPSHIETLIEEQTESPSYFFINEQQETVELYVLEKVGIQSLSLPQLRFYYYQEYAEMILSRFRKEFPVALLALKKRREKCLLTQDLQHTFHRLYQTIVDQFLPYDELETRYEISRSFGQLDVFKLLLTQIEKLLIFLEGYAPGYLDEAQKISFRKYVLHCTQEKERIDRVVQNVKNAVQEPELQQLLISPLKKISYLQPDSISIHTFHYCFAYLKAIEDWIETERNPTVGGVIDFLKSQHNNSPEFLSFLTSTFRERYSSFSTAKEKVAFIYRMVRPTRPTRPIHYHPYDPDYPALEEQLSDWLSEEEEILYMLEEQPAPSTKLQVSLSVSQLSLLSRMLYESGVFEGSRQELFQAIADCFVTSSRQKISADSLRNKYYNIERSAVQSTRKLFKDLASTLDSL